MTKEEAIEQLECIKYYSESMRNDEDSEDVWHKDIAALTMAIKIIKKDLKGLQSQ